jgi:hypothetical protein
MTAEYHIVCEQEGGYVAHGAARQLWDSTASEIIITGPAETGKTLACLHKLDYLLWTHPGAQAVLVRKVRDTIYPTCLQTYLKKVLLPDSPVRAYGGERPAWFDYPNGSRLWLAGLDDPGKALSSERDFVCVNQAEELTSDDWQVLTTRTTGRAGNAPFGQCLGDCNPGPPHHWIKHRPSLTLLESRHQDNPVLFDGQDWTEQGRRTLAALDALTGVRRERLRFGRWVSAEGTVYQFDPRVHKIGRDQVPPCSRAVAGVDWGLRNPGVIGVWLLDGDGRAYLAHEVYQTGKLIDWWVSRAQEAKRRYPIEAFVCDPSEPAYVEAFLRAGLYALPGDNAVAPGIQAVEARLAVAPDGRPRLFVVDGCLAERDEALAADHKPVCTEQEFDAYVYPKGADGRPIKEVPVDLHNHGMDALRYAIMYADARQRLGGERMNTGPRRAASRPPPGAFGSGDARRFPQRF